MLAPFLFIIFTNDCVSEDQSVHVIKFSDDTSVEGCIENADETPYREEVQRMVGWCADNNLKLNVSKTKEMIVDFRKKKTPIHPLSINGVEVEQVESFRFLGTKNLKRSQLGHKHTVHYKKGTTTPVLPEAAQEIRHCSEDYDTVLPRNH